MTPKEEMRMKIRYDFLLLLLLYNCLIWLPASMFSTWVVGADNTTRPNYHVSKNIHIQGQPNKNHEIV